MFYVCSQQGETLDKPSVLSTCEEIQEVVLCSFGYACCSFSNAAQVAAHSLAYTFAPVFSGVFFKVGGLCTR